MRTIQRWCGMTLVALALWGCQKAATPTTAEGDNISAPSQDDEGNVLPVASIGSPPPQPLKKLDGMELEEDLEMEEDDVEILDDPQPGTPEYMLREVAQLRFQPLPPNTEGNRDQLRAIRKERNDKIIDLTAKVIAQTHQDKKKERIFEVAVHYMLEARMELALQGDKESIDAIYDDAASLWERDPKSKSAADAAFNLVSFAYSNAKLKSAKDTKWLLEFHRQAMHFAKNFPQEERRALAMLFTAARSCELYGMTKPAIEAYTQLQQSFPQSNQALRAKGVIRRLQLVGQTLRKLGGPTIDGGFLSMEEDLVGKPVLLVFWESKATPFIEELPALREFQKAYAKQGLTLVGVCLDEDQAAVETFVKKHNITWPQIFYSETGKLGWNNPIATYYGVQDVSNWLIDGRGVVVSTSVKVANLEEQLSPLLKRGISRLPSNPPR